MFAEFSLFWDFHMWTVIAIGAVVMAIVSIVADRQRQRRIKLDHVGFIPWTGISVGAILLALVAAALAIKTG
jgi:hypothetical protein